MSPSPVAIAVNMIWGSVVVEPTPIVMYTDASVSPEVGVTGAIVCQYGQELLRASWQVKPGTSSSQAEVIGLYNCLRDHGASGVKIVYTDSQSLVDQVTERAAVTRDIRKYIVGIRDLLKRFQITLKWIPREYNKADRFTRSVMRKLRKDKLNDKN